MKGISEKHRQICDLYLQGMNQTQAYLSVYQGNYDNANDNSYVMFKRPEVIEYIKEQQALSAEATHITKQEILRRLDNIYFSALEANKFADCNKALAQMSKMLGYDEPKKIELSGGIENKVVKVSFKKEDE